MPDFVIGTLNGRPIFSIEYDGPSREPNLRRVLKRVSISAEIAALGLSEVARLWAKGKIPWL